jgi:hypothetical protein
MNDTLQWRYATKKFDPLKKDSQSLNLKRLLEVIAIVSILFWLTAMEIYHRPRSGSKKAT